MQRQTLSGFEKYGKRTRRAQFLADTDRLAAWAALCAGIEPFDAKASPEAVTLTAARADAAAGVFANGRSFSQIVMQGRNPTVAGPRLGIRYSHRRFFGASSDGPAAGPKTGSLPGREN
jgi:hypothetical protein